MSPLQAKLYSDCIQNEKSTLFADYHVRISLINALKQIGLISSK